MYPTSISTLRQKCIGYSLAIAGGIGLSIGALPEYRPSVALMSVLILVVFVAALHKYEIVGARNLQQFIASATLAAQES
jgi:hypothetical protein